jgi:hypothetical protein
MGCQFRYSDRQPCKSVWQIFFAVRRAYRQPGEHRESIQTTRKAQGMIVGDELLRYLKGPENGRKAKAESA